MSNYLYYDVYSIKSDLKDMLYNSNSILSNTKSMAESLNHIDSIIDKGFSGVQSQLDDISFLLEDMLDVMINFRNTTFIQNEQRNQLLASIDATLKAPNKTAANEKYEISLELAERNKYEKAIQLLKEAIELNPLHYRSYIQLTLNLLKMKNYEEALHYAQESINFAPKDNEILAYTYSLIARASEKMKDYQGALNNINLAIKLNSQPNYIYETARYYALLGDVSQSMTELKQAIELNSEYFAISLVDSAFFPYREEREQFLTSLKEELESKLKYVISQMDTIQFNEYKFEEIQGYNFDVYTSYSIASNYKLDTLNLSYKPWDFIPKQELLVSDYIGDYTDGWYASYNYNTLVKVFFVKYNHIVSLHRTKLQSLKELKNINTYVAFRNSYNEFLSYKKEHNYFILTMKRYLNRHKEDSISIGKILRVNFENATEFYNKAKKRLQVEKKRSPFQFVLDTIFQTPMVLSNDGKILEEVCETLEKGVKKLQIDIENEGRHTSAVQRLVNEVLIERPLPNTID